MDTAMEYGMWFPWGVVYPDLGVNAMPTQEPGFFDAALDANSAHNAYYNAPVYAVHSGIPQCLYCANYTLCDGGPNCPFASIGFATESLLQTQPLELHSYPRAQPVYRNDLVAPQFQEMGSTTDGGVAAAAAPSATLPAFFTPQEPLALDADPAQDAAVSYNANDYAAPVPQEYLDGTHFVQEGHVPAMHATEPAVNGTAQGLGGWQPQESFTEPVFTEQTFTDQNTQEGVAKPAFITQTHAEQLPQDTYTGQGFSGQSHAGQYSQQETSAEAAFNGQDYFGEPQQHNLTGQAYHGLPQQELYSGQTYNEQAYPGQYQQQQVGQPRPGTMSAYAKLDFADGDYMIQTQDVLLGRNMEIYKEWKARRNAADRAAGDLSSYRDEPSQPSQHDLDRQGEPSSSSRSLDGRPPAQSAHSEGGGIIYFAQEYPHDDWNPSERRLLRRGAKSSTNSVDPSRLQASVSSDPGTGSGDAHNEDRTFAYVPIHTQIEDDIGKISRRHLMFSYNSAERQWEVEICGNRAYVNETLHDKNDVVPLEHGDEIYVTSIKIVFSLPQQCRSRNSSPHPGSGTFDETPESSKSQLATSPIRRLSRVVEDIGSDEPTPVRKPDKGKGKAVEKPKAAGKSPAEPKAKPKMPSPQPLPIEPGAGLENIPAGEMPEKRKGPGRPPKNGAFSKRDKGLVDKKIKEYQKKGLEPPPFNQILEIVRQESRMKTASAKAQGNGELPTGASVVPSIETDQQATAVGALAGVRAPSAAHDLASMERERKTSPKPTKRTARSLSPCKPKEECTEEELKKPTQTYLYQIDQILREHPDGEGDLQDIYARMMKKWPYYTHTVDGNGWQSSVRHNLLQHDRFKESGKSGKGKMWSLDTDIPLEKEGKKKKSSPKAGSGQFHHLGQYGPSQFGGHFPMQPPNGQHHPNAGPYMSPYAQGGPHFQNGPQQAPYNHQNQQPNGIPQPKPETPWQRQINKIAAEQMAYTAQYSHEGVDVQKQKTALCEEIINALSNAFHSSDAAVTTLPVVSDPRDVAIAEKLKAMFASDELRSAAMDAGLLPRNGVAESTAPVQVGAAVQNASQQNNLPPATQPSAAAAAQATAPTPTPTHPTAPTQAPPVKPPTAPVNGLTDPAAPQTDSQSPERNLHKRSAEESTEPDAKRVRTE